MREGGCIQDWPTYKLYWMNTFLMDFVLELKNAVCS